MATKTYYIGLMSGTSLDAIDAALVSFPDGRPVLHHTLNYPFPNSLRDEIRALCTPGDNEIERLGMLDITIGRLFADSAIQLLSEAAVSAADVQAIGSHGQTVRHRPEKHFTLQIGDPNIIAQQTGITTVADFRRRDMAADGQGAPLAPAFHAALFRNEPATSRVVLNIGGIANITLLPAHPDAPVTGFDTGPGNVLMDAWIQQHQHQEFDRNGQWAASGTVNQALLETLLQDDFFQRVPPKSTGREHFNREWLEQRLNTSAQTLSPADVQATLSELTAASISEAIRHYAEDTTEVVVCGGGARNTDLLQRLARQLAPATVKTIDDVGLAAEWVEAVAFAWLAHETLALRPGNLAGVTGASQPVILGGIYPGKPG